MMADIRDVPSTEAGRRMLRSISPIYDKAYVARWLIEVMGVEMEEARLYVDELRLQAFPDTATWGLRYWEQRYHIPVDESASLEERRARITKKRWKYAPMNPARLEDYIYRICHMPTTVAEVNPEYRFEVTINSAGSEIQYNDIISMIRRVKPSHLEIKLMIEAQCGIWIASKAEKYPFSSRASGTYPYRNRIGRQLDTQIEINSEGSPYAFRSIMTGTRDTGTEPVQNTEGSAPLLGISAQSDAVAFAFISKLCGTDTL